jgi:hypothetical protein
MYSGFHPALGMPIGEHPHAWRQEETAGVPMRTVPLIACSPSPAAH